MSTVAHQPVELFHFMSFLQLHLQQVHKSTQEPNGSIRPSQACLKELSFSKLL